MTLTQEETARLIRYLQQKFSNDRLTIKLRDKVNDSAEVLLDGEFIGVLYKDEDEGEVSYNFSMAILDFDLPASA